MSNWPSAFGPVDTHAIDAFEVGELLAALADKSLVVLDPFTGRFRLLETVRDYARVTLANTGEAEMFRDRHLDHFLALTEQAEPQFTGPDQGVWLEKLETEHDNLRAALAWSSEQADNHESGVRLAGAMPRFWDARGHLAEGRRWFSIVLSQGAANETQHRAKALNGAGVLAYEQADYKAARAFLEESLAIGRRLGDRSGIAHSLNSLGNLAHDQGDYNAAQAQYEESLAIRREMGDKRGIAVSLTNLGQLANLQADHVTACALQEEAAAAFSEVGDQRGFAGSLRDLGYVAIEMGDCLAARSFQTQSLMISRSLGDRRGIAMSLVGLAQVAAALGEHSRTANLCGAAERLREEIGMPIRPSEQSRCDRLVSKSRAGMGDNAAFDRTWQQGRAMTIEQAIEMAMDEGKV